MALSFPDDKIQNSDYTIQTDADYGKLGGEIENGIKAGQGFGSTYRSEYCPQWFQKDSGYVVQWSTSGRPSFLEFPTYNCKFCENKVSIESAAYWDSDIGYEEYPSRLLSSYVWDCRNDVLEGESLAFKRNGGWGTVYDVQAYNLCENQCYDHCYDECDDGCFNSGCVDSCTSSCAASNCLTGCATGETSCLQCYGTCFDSCVRCFSTCYGGCTSCASCTSSYGG